MWVSSSLPRKKKYCFRVYNILQVIKVWHNVLRCVVVFGRWNETEPYLMHYISVFACLFNPGPYFVLSERCDTVYVSLWPGQLVWCMLPHCCVYSAEEINLHAYLSLSLSLTLSVLLNFATIFPCDSKIQSCTLFFILYLLHIAAIVLQW